jgi:F0F1-type ATP synthase alpha subunit
LFAIEHHAYEGIAVDKALQFEAELIKYAKVSHQEMLDRIDSSGAISSEDERSLKELVSKFRDTYTTSGL